MQMLLGPLLEIVCFVLVFVVLYLVGRKRRAWAARSKMPFGELRRRLAGESLRLKLEQLDDKLAALLLYMVVRGPKSEETEGRLRYLAGERQ